jgi:hypothetical protein
MMGDVLRNYVISIVRFIHTLDNSWSFIHLKTKFHSTYYGYQPGVQIYILISVIKMLISNNIGAQNIPYNCYCILIAASC